MAHKTNPHFFLNKVLPQHTASICSHNVNCYFHTIPEVTVIADVVISETLWPIKIKILITCCDSCSVMSRLFTTPGTVACQASLSMGLLQGRQEHWSRLPSPPPGDLPNPWIEHRSPVLQVGSSPSEPPQKPFKNAGVDSTPLLYIINILGHIPTKNLNELHRR